MDKSNPLLLLYIIDMDKSNPLYYCTIGMDKSNPLLTYTPRLVPVNQFYGITI